MALILGSITELYSLTEIKASKKSFLEILENGGAQYYGLYDSSLSISEDAEIWLNISKAYIIADNISEEMICLDYRHTPNIPRVLASDYSQGIGRWREIAKTFEEFWNILEPVS